MEVYARFCRRRIRIISGGSVEIQMRQGKSVTLGSVIGHSDRHSTWAEHWEVFLSTGSREEEIVGAELVGVRAPR